MLIIVAAAFVFGVGLLQIVAGDVVWKVDRAFKEMQGLHPERTDAYESGRILRGVFFMLMGVVILIVWLVVR